MTLCKTNERIFCSNILKILLVALRGAKMKSQAPGAVVFLSDPRLTKLRISPSVFRYLRNGYGKGQVGDRTVWW